MIHDGMKDLSLLATAIGMGARVRPVSDSKTASFSAPGKTAKTNPELVEKAVSLVQQMGFERGVSERSQRNVGDPKKHSDE